MPPSGPQARSAGRHQDPVAFGRTCRAALDQVAPDLAMRDLDRQHDRRCARATQRPDGMSALHVEVGGVDGAFLHATLDAFRRFDATGEVRTPGRVVPGRPPR